MPWTNLQKQLAVRACRAAGVTEEQRTNLILMNFPNASYGGDITSTSPRLTNGDFEAFMAIVENFAGGKVLHFTAGYWRAHSENNLARMRHRVLAIAGELEKAGKLIPNGVGLAGWIEKRVGGGATRRMEDLEFNGMKALILGLEAYARQSAVRLPAVLANAGDRPATRQRCGQAHSGPCESASFVERRPAPAPSLFAEVK